MDTVETPQLAVVEPETKWSLEQQMDSIMRVADLLEKGTRGTTDLAGILGVTRKTAIKYRNLALKLLADENKSMNTQAMRNMEIGRLQYWIDKLTKDVQAVTGDDKDDREYRIKLLGRLDNFQGRLHAITGLNTSVNVNYDEKKRIIFNFDTGTQQKPNKDMATSPLEAQAQPDIIEAELVDSSSS